MNIRENIKIGIYKGWNQRNDGRNNNNYRINKKCAFKMFWARIKDGWSKMKKKYTKETLVRGCAESNEFWGAI